MKKTIMLLIAIIFLPLAQYAFHLDLGISYGLRKINDTKIKNTYGDGYVFFPSLDIHIAKGIFAGFGYEGGYSKSGTIGIYQDPTKLKINGMEIFLGYQYRIKFFVPFLKLGCAYFSYQQTFDNPSLKDFQVDDKAWTVTFAGGVKLIIFKGVFLSTEIRYIPLKVKPFEEEVDLGGIRFLAGIGFSI